MDNVGADKHRNGHNAHNAATTIGPTTRRYSPHNADNTTKFRPKIFGIKKLEFLGYRVALFDT